MSKAARQRSARERLAEERKRQQQRDMRVRAILVSLLAVVVVAAVVGGGLYFNHLKNKRDQIAAAYKGPLAPVSRQADGSIAMSQQGAKAPLLEIFEDFQCPVCKQFEQTSGNLVKKLAAEGKLKVTYIPFWLFKQQPEPTRGNSERAANAALCTPADKWASYHDTLFKFQSAEGSPGFANKDLIAWAKDLGFGDATFEKCVTDKQKVGQLDQMSTYATKNRGVEGTPTLFLNGKKLDQNQTFDPRALEQALTAAPPAPESGSASPAPSPKAPSPSSSKK